MKFTPRWGIGAAMLVIAFTLKATAQIQTLVNEPPDGTLAT